MTSTPRSPRKPARVVLGSRLAALVIGASSSGALLACSGSIVSLAGDQPTVDGGFSAVDPETISETTRSCGTDTSHPFVCCRFEQDGSTALSCGAWVSAPFNPCPDGYAKYANPTTCCTVSGACTTGKDNTETDATMLSVLDAGSDSGP
jgi:hypothetical protein